MAGLDVAVPTSYYYMQQVLDEYRQVRNLWRATFLDHKVVFDFDALEGTQTCVKFNFFFVYETYFPVYDYYILAERFNETAGRL